MILELYSVRDSKAAFSGPFVAPNEGFALRMFIGSVRSSTPNVANTFPEDKELWKLGTLDDQTGELMSDLKCVAYASSYVLPAAPQETKPEPPKEGDK